MMDASAKIGQKSEDSGLLDNAGLLDEDSLFKFEPGTEAIPTVEAEDETGIESLQKKRKRKKIIGGVIGAVILLIHRRGGGQRPHREEGHRP